MQKKEGKKKKKKREKSIYKNECARFRLSSISNEVSSPSLVSVYSFAHIKMDK